MKINDSGLWEAFLGINKHGNFSKTAQALNIPLPVLSKKISKLEEHLGVRLFHRTTRSVSPTQEALSILPQVQSLFEDMNQLENFFQDQTQKLSGTIRITTAPFVANNLLIPLLDEFLKLHPSVKIELNVSEEILNMVESNLDLAIRIQEPTGSDLVYKQLIPNHLVFCASPEYLKKVRTPLSQPKDLKNHHVYLLNSLRKCRFESDGTSVDQFTKPTPIFCNNGEFITKLALNHMGIILRAEIDVRQHIAEGRLVQVLKKHPVSPFGNLHLVIPNRKYVLPRVRALMTFLNERIV